MPCLRHTSATFISFAAASLRIATICSALKRDFFMSPPPPGGSGLPTYSVTPLTGRRPGARDNRIVIRGWCSLTDIESAPLTATMELSRHHRPQPGGALMKRSTKYVALDVHQATTVASVREEG